MFYKMSTDFQKYFIFLTERDRIGMNIFNINVPKDEISMIFDPYGDIENYSTSLYLHKSKIALDDGDILGMEAAGYLNNHIARQNLNVGISLDEAKSKLNLDKIIAADSKEINKIKSQDEQTNPR